MPDWSVVLALMGGGFALKRFRRRGNRVWLQVENPSCKDTEICEGMTFSQTNS